MDIVTTLFVISGIMFIGFLAEIIFKKTNIPDVLILIGVGIILSSVLGWTNKDVLAGGATLFTTFALVFVLFQGALSINFVTLIKSLPSTFKLTILNFILTVIVVALIAYFGFGYNFNLALLIGMILGGTSSAVVIPLVNNVEIKEKYSSVLTLESALSDVLCIIGTITVLEIIATGQVLAESIFKSVFTSFSLAIVTGLIIGILWVILLHKSDHLAKSYMMTIAMVVALYALVESPLIQASGAIAALVFGLLLGNSKSLLELKKRKKSQEDERVTSVISFSAKSFYSEISFFVKTFFFVYLGILIDFSNPTIFIYGAILTIGIYLVRPFAVKIVFPKENIQQKERSMLEILIPKGLAAAVLAGVALQSGALVGYEVIFTNTVLSVVLLSIVLTSVLIFLVEREKFTSFVKFLHPKEK
jgi:NhaP-type Na+/H+ or K+/H+ antiporter